MKLRNLPNDEAKKEMKLVFFLNPREREREYCPLWFGLVKGWKRKENCVNTRVTTRFNSGVIKSWYLPNIILNI